MTKMIEISRLYTKKGKKLVSKQKFLLDASSIESVRSSTVLTGQKATVRTKSGMEIPTSETVATISTARDKALACAGVAVAAAAAPARRY